jgi:hypothetical protein
VTRDGPTSHVISDDFEASTFDGRAVGVYHLTEQSPSPHEPDVDLGVALAWDGDATLREKAIGAHVDRCAARGQRAQYHAPIRSGAPLQGEWAKPIFDEHDIGACDRARVFSRPIRHAHRDGATRFERERHLPPFTAVEGRRDERGGDSIAVLGA